MFYHYNITEKDIERDLYGKGKIPCRLIEYFGHHKPNSKYNYKYKQKIIPKNESKL